MQKHLSALRESEEKYRVLFEGSTHGILIIDLETERFSYANPSLCRMLGYSEMELTQLGIADIHPKDSLEQARKEFESFRQGEKTLPAALPCLRKDGVVFYADIVAVYSIIHNRRYVVGFFADITDRKQAEEEIRRRDFKYRELVEHAQDGIFTITVPGQFLIVNTKFCQMLGYTLEECLRRNILDTYPDDMRPVGTQRLADLQSGQALRFERPMKRQDGGIVFVEAIAWKDSDGNVQAIVRDITERKQVESEKEKLESQNRQLQKAESLGRMAGAIAHTFNNQLGVVIGNLEMAIDELPKGVGPVNSLTAAMLAANRAAEVSGQMLAYLGQSFDKHELMDLAEACRRNLPIIQAAMPGTVALEADLPSPGPAVMANATEIRQVLTNLITNAWEAVGAGRGSIHLSVKTVSPADIPSRHCYPIDWRPQDNDYACLDVTDTNGGIADEDIENLFDPFFSSKCTGRGMGLSVVLGIVKAHGGAIMVENELDRGSTFRVFLPVSAAEVPRQPDKAAQPLAIEGGGTVLLVDDEDMLRDMAAAMLTRLGFTVLAAKDGVEAVEVFNDHKDEIRLVLSDLTMPRLDGWETIIALRKLSPGIPVILASGYDKVQVMAGEHPELPQVFLGKPYGLQVLKEAIGQALVSRKK